MSNIVLANKNPASMSKEELVVLCRERPEEAAAAIYALATLNTIMLPDTAFVQRGKDGLMRKLRVRVTLSEALREVVKIPGKKFKDADDRWQEGPPMYDLSAVGIRKLNQTAGLHVLTPDAVVVAGKRCPNPYIEVDERFRRPQRVYVRRVVIGSAMATGNMVATDITLVLDLGLYILENLLKKLRYCNKPEMLGIWGTADEKPQVPKGSWRFYSTESDVGVWFNLEHQDFQKAMEEHVQRCKFADRIAQTLAERNAMRAHPGMPPSIAADANGRITVQMDAWTQSMTADQIERFRDMVNAGTLQEEMEVRTAEMRSTESDAEDVQHVAMAEGENENLDETGAEPKAEAEPVKRAPAAADEEVPPVERAKLVERANEVYTELSLTWGKKKLAEALRGIGIDVGPGKGPDKATDDQLKQLIALKDKA